MLLISFIAHLLIFLIAPSQNVLVTNMVVTNTGVSALSEVDMPRLITQTMLKTFPISIFCCATISALFSYFFSRGITTPILSLSKSANQMSKLEPDAKAAVLSTDEIGALATDINNLYQSLLLTIRNLELEKEKVSLAEKEKIDFLRTASHELKTPVTELNATLENMILGIGEYRDYETYLPKCKEITEQLGDMIRDILNASRLQTQGNNEPCSNFSLRTLLTELCEPYRLIAEAKGVKFKIELSSDAFVYLPEGRLKKAISNILSNAVNYTEAGQSISVVFDKNKLSVSNECSVLPPEQLQHIFEPFYRPDLAHSQATGGNGLGLYIPPTTGAAVGRAVAGRKAPWSLPSGGIPPSRRSSPCRNTAAMSLTSKATPSPTR